MAGHATVQGGVGGRGSPAQAVRGLQGLWPTKSSTKGQEEVLKLTGARVRAGRLCRASTSSTGGKSRAALGEEMLQWHSERLDPSQGFDVDLRGCSRGQGRSGIAGGEESQRRSELTGAESLGKSRVCRPRSRGQRARCASGRQGEATEMVCRGWGAVVRRGRGGAAALFRRQDGA